MAIAIYNTPQHTDISFINIMTFEGHLIFALASTILSKKMALSSTIGDGDWWHIVGGGLITCLLPDIDHPKSILGQRLRWVSLPISRIFKHRKFTHSLLAIIIGIIPLTLRISQEISIPLDVAHGMIVGYCSHIIADMLTPAGVPLLWPCRWRFRLPIVHSSKGNKLERIVCIAALVCALEHPQGGTLLIKQCSVFSSVSLVICHICNIFC